MGRDPCAPINEREGVGEYRKKKKRRRRGAGGKEGEREGEKKREIERMSKQINS